MAHDAAIPQLRRLTNLAEAAGLLAPALTGWPPSGTARPAGVPQVRSVTVLRAHPGSRWTLGYVVRHGGAERTLFAKVYARDRGDVATTLSVLRGRGLGGGESAQVVAPVAYLPTLRLLLLEQAPGETARAALHRGQGGVVGERTARWLAALHGAGVLPAAYRLQDPMARADRWARALGAHAPALRKSGGQLLAALAEAQPAWSMPPALVHGDFGVSHVLLAAETTTVIDWDAWRVGDCAEDAGRFLASLHHVAARDPARAHAADEAARTFARTYRAAVPAARASLAFYEARACLRKAARLSAHRTPRHLRRAEVLLAAGARALSAGGR